MHPIQALLSALAKLGGGVGYDASPLPVYNEDDANAIKKARQIAPSSKLTNDQIVQYYHKYGDKLFSNPPNMQVEVTRANPLSNLASKVLGIQAHAEAPQPSPTPADSQYPTKLAPLENDPGAAYNPIIEKSAQQQGIPAPILKAVLAHESMQFAPQYVKGMHTDQHGMGIAGIDDRAHPEISQQQAFDPNFAIPYAAKLLKGYHDQQGDWGKALRYYNGGGNYASPQPGFQGVPIEQRTMDYMNNVYNQALKYGQK